MAKHRAGFTFCIAALWLVPIGGVVASLLPLQGWLIPVADHAVTGWQAFVEVMARPGFWRALWISVSSTLAATVLSVLSLFLLITSGYDRRWLSRLSGAFTTLFAIPHLTFAIGFAFLIAPSGLIMRLLSPELTGLQRPPDWLIPGDPGGLSLIFALLIKEWPFLALIALSSLAQPGLRRQWLSLRMLGYHRHLATLYIVLPALYPRMRYAVYAVLAYAISTVDMGLLLGPSQPSSLAVWLVELGARADPADMPLMAAGTLFFLLATGFCMLVWRTGELCLAYVIRQPEIWTRRYLVDRVLSVAGAVNLFGQLVISLGVVIVLVLWMGAGRWRFPDASPEVWSLGKLHEALQIYSGSIVNSLIVAVASSLMALIIVIGMLVMEQSEKGRARLVNIAMLLPLMVPQLAYLSGLNTLFLYAGADPGWILLTLNHTIMVLPPLFLVLCGPWRAMDPRLIQLAQTLGFSTWKTIWQIRLPILLNSVLVALAIGFTVSHAQYLATLYGAGGRIETTISETMALATGGDRRQAAALGIIIFVVPLIALLSARIIGYLRLRKFAGLSGSGS